MENAPTQRSASKMDSTKTAVEIEGKRWPTMAAGGIETEVFRKTTMTATRTTTASLFVGIILLLLLFCQRKLTFKNLLISTTDPPHQIITTITTPKITITLLQLTLNLLLRIWRTAPADTTRHTTPHSLSIVSTTLTMRLMRGKG